MIIDDALSKAALTENFAVSASLTDRIDLAQFAKKAAHAKTDYALRRPP